MEELASGLFSLLGRGPFSVGRFHQSVQVGSFPPWAYVRRQGIRFLAAAAEPPHWLYEEMDWRGRELVINGLKEGNEPGHYSYVKFAR